MKFKQGFSLIELMVVIAIVGILSAIAVPAYQSYLSRSRLTSIVSIMDGILEQAKAFHDVGKISTAGNGATYPSAFDLGLSTSTTSATADNPTAISPYMTVLTILNYTSDFELDVELDTAALGYNASVVSFMNLYCVLYRDRTSGVYNTGCFYSYGS